MKNQNFQPVQYPIQPTQTTIPVQPTVAKHPFSSYLEEVEGFCNSLAERQYLPKNLTIKQATEIVVIADRLQIPRLDALKAWQVCSKGVVISADFLRCLFVRRNMLIGGIFYTDMKGGWRATISDGNLSYCGHSYKEQLLDHTTCNNNPQQALKELALMDALSKAFPQLLMGIICTTQVPDPKPSLFTLTLRGLKFLGKLFNTNPALTSLLAAGFVLGIWFSIGLTNGTGFIYWTTLLAVTAEFTVSTHKGDKINSDIDCLKLIGSISNYCAKKLHAFIGSCITSSKNDTSASDNPKTAKQSVPKTTQFSDTQDEDLFLDLEALEVVKPQASYNTNPLIEPKQTTFVN